MAQGRNHAFKVGGPFPWSRVLLPFYRKNRQVYPVWCSRLHNHTLFIKRLCKSWGFVQILGSPNLPDPQWLRPWHGVHLNEEKQYVKADKVLYMSLIYTYIRVITACSTCTCHSIMIFELWFPSHFIIISAG